MYKEAVLKRNTLTVTLVVAAVALLLFSTKTPVAYVASTQGKGGTVKPLPTPTPMPKKATPPKRGTTAPARTATAKPNGSGKADTAANERVFWESIRNSTDPEDFREYLRKYPNGEFAGLAKNRLKTLEASQPKTSAIPDASKETTRTNANGTTSKPDATTGSSGAKPDNTSGPSNTAPTATPVVGGAKVAPQPGAVVKNQMGMAFVYVPAGTFMMGSEKYTSTMPIHQVTFEEGFFLGRYEVTQAQWQEVMGNNPSYIKNCDQCPVERVSWSNVQEFIRRMNARGDGFIYRLPSEAEWEYACRAGTTGEYAGSLDAMGWYEENSGDTRLSGEYINRQFDANHNRTHPVGQKQPNAWGLYDMHGNVFEWCEDWYHENYNGAPTDGSAWLRGGEQSERVARGGAWNFTATGSRSAYRNRLRPDIDIYNNFGLRLVAVPRTQ